MSRLSRCTSCEPLRCVVLVSTLAFVLDALGWLLHPRLLASSHCAACTPAILAFDVEECFGAEERLSLFEAQRRERECDVLFSAVVDDHLRKAETQLTTQTAGSWWWLGRGAALSALPSWDVCVEVWDEHLARVTSTDTKTDVFQGTNLQEHHPFHSQPTLVQEGLRNATCAMAALSSCARKEMEENTRNRVSSLLHFMLASHWTSPLVAPDMTAKPSLGASTRACRNEIEASWTPDVPVGFRLAEHLLERLWPLGLLLPVSWSTYLAETACLYLVMFVPIVIFLMVLRAQYYAEQFAIMRCAEPLKAHETTMDFLPSRDVELPSGQVDAFADLTILSQASYIAVHGQADKSRPLSSGIWSMKDSTLNVFDPGEAKQTFAIVGKPGVGKTYVASLLADRAPSKGSTKHLNFLWLKEKRALVLDTPGVLLGPLSTPRAADGCAPEHECRGKEAMPHALGQLSDCVLVCVLKHGAQPTRKDREWLASLSEAVPGRSLIVVHNLSDVTLKEGAPMTFKQAVEKVADSMRDYEWSTDYDSFLVTATRLPDATEEGATAMFHVSLFEDSSEPGQCFNLRCRQNLLELVSQFTDKEATSSCQMSLAEQLRGTFERSLKRLSSSLGTPELPVSETNAAEASPNSRGPRPRRLTVSGVQLLKLTSEHDLEAYQLVSSLTLQVSKVPVVTSASNPSTSPLEGQ